MWEPIAAVSVIGVAGLLIGGWPIYKEAFESAVMALSALAESASYPRTQPRYAIPSARFAQDED